jgi:ribose 5-phosphate isomerase B
MQQLASEDYATQIQPVIFLGADHGGFALKEQVKTWLTEWGYTFQDLGTHQLDPDDDYPQFAFAVAEAVAARPAGSAQLTGSTSGPVRAPAQTPALGVLLCRSGGGVIIAANKVAGIRAVQVNNPQEARHAKEHNNANVISLAADWLTPETAQHTLKTFLTTPFTNEPRHTRRIAQIEKYEYMQKRTA